MRYRCAASVPLPCSSSKSHIHDAWHRVAQRARGIATRARTRGSDVITGVPSVPGVPLPLSNLVCTRAWPGAPVMRRIAALLGRLSLGTNSGTPAVEHTRYQHRCAELRLTGDQQVEPAADETTSLSTPIDAEDATDSSRDCDRWDPWPDWDPTDCVGITHPIRLEAVR